MNRRLVFIAAVVLLAIGIALVPPFYVNLLSYIGLYSMVAVGLVLLTGVAGVTSFGQAAFVGMGAYATAALTTMYGLSPWVSLATSLALTGLSALILGAITFRLSGHYLALGTMAWGLGLYFILGNVEQLGGSTGIANVPKLPWHVLYDNSGRLYAALIWLAAIATCVAVEHILASRKGRAIRALKGASQMAESFGVNTYLLKIQIFVFAALAASFSGWLYAHFIGFVNPTPFGLYPSMEYLFMAVIGGAGQVWGAIIGAAVITMLRHWLQDLLPALLGRSGNYDLIVLGAILMLVMQRARDGIAPLIARHIRQTPHAALPEAARVVPMREPAVSGQPLLELAGVSKHFGGLVAVNEISFQMATGQILGLIGPNGAGKSTTFNLITNVLQASAGEIRFRGRRIEALDMRKVAALGITRTFQHVQLVPGMSVLENVALGGYRHGRTGLAAAALRLDGAEEAQVFAAAALQIGRIGLKERMHDPAGSLSLGEQRMVEVARALITNPTLLLLDEPAAGLRHLEKQNLAKLLKSLREDGLSILLVEHDMDFVMNLTDRLVVMDFGQKLAEGEPHQIRSNSQVVEAYLGEAA